AQAIASGLSQRDAYRKAGYSSKTNAALDANASRLISADKVRARIKEIQSVAAAETALTLEEHMKELKLLREMAKAEGDIKAAIAVEVKRGEVKQFYVKKVEMGAPGEFDQLTNEELQRAIIDQTRELAELDPEFAKELRLTQQAKGVTSTEQTAGAAFDRPTRFGALMHLGAVE